MSGHYGYIEDEDESLATATILTIVQLVTAANNPIEIVAWGVGFDSIVAGDEPIRCRLQLQTSAGTSAASTIQQHRGSRADGFDTSGLENFTVEPSKGIAWATKLVHPTSGGYEIWYPRDARPEVADSGRVGVEVISGTLASTLDDVSAFIIFEE